MQIFLILIIAVSLSMDAFSLSLAYGTLNISKKEMYTLSLIVGIYHFFMPLLGSLIGDKILRYLNIDYGIIICIILGIIGIGMIRETFENKEEVEQMSLFKMLLFGLAVSIDSFSVGITLKGLTSSYLLAASTFSLMSALFTYMGLYLGNRISMLIGKYSTFIGGLVLILIGIIALLQ